MCTTLNTFHHHASLYKLTIEVTAVCRCLQVLCFGATEGEMGGTGGAWSKRQGGTKPADPKESTPSARESAAKNRNGQVTIIVAI